MSKLVKPHGGGELKPLLLSGDALKQELETNKNVCVYFKDANGNVIPLSDGSIKKYAVGCDFIDISGLKCGQEII